MQACWLLQVPVYEAGNVFSCLYYDMEINGFLYSEKLQRKYEYINKTGNK
jgi:hypothetical protein